MKKAFFLLILCACSSGGSLMTMNNFHDIPLGATTEEVVSCAGQPFAIRTRCDGVIEYEYIERIKIGARDAEERRYLLLIKDGVVIEKKLKESTPLPYGFDSYEMQTTENLIQ